MIRSLLIVLLLFSTNIYAELSEPSQQDILARPPQVELFCPEPQMLVNKNSYWEVNDAWRSDTQSLGTKITSFIGTQWFGVNVGKIVCLYKEDVKLGFPVALITIHPVIILDPEGAHWTVAKEGYKQCASGDVKDCPFYQKKQEDMSNIYEQIKYQGPSDNEKE